MGAPIYRPDNSQDSARYAINPFQVATISLYDINRTQGEYMPQFEGNFIYVEQLDYPVILTLIDSLSGVERSIILRVGDEIHASFKGFTLTHPLMARPSVSNTFGLKLTIGKGAVSRSNEFARPMMNMIAAFRQTANTAVNQIINIYIPPGARGLERIQVSGLGTTITGANLQPLAGGTLCSPPVIAANGFNYNAPNQLRPVMNVRNATTSRGNQYVAEYEYLALPSYATELQVDILGTVMTAVDSVYAIFS